MHSLSSICEYRKGKINVSDLTVNNYVSTENLLPNKGGLVEATNLPSTSTTQIYHSGDILVSNIRPYFKKIWLAKEIGGCSNDVLVFKAKQEVDSLFLYYVLANDRFFDYSTASSKGTKMPRGDKDAIMIYEVPQFDFLEQKKIGRFLRSIDEKLDTNNQINRNLQEQAIAVFKEKIWSKDKNGTIGDYCIMKSGFAFKSSWWTDEGVKVIKIGDINQDNLSLATCSYVDEDKVEKAGDFSVKAGDLVLAMTGATIGKFAMVPERSETILVNQRVGKFFLGEEPLKKVPFIYCTLKMDDVYSEIIGRGQGSAQPNISGNDVMTISCVIPTDIEIDEFNDWAEPIFASIVKNQNENEKLANLRDSLLPKLMSGELDVSELDI